MMMMVMKMMMKKDYNDVDDSGGNDDDYNADKEKPHDKVSMRGESGSKENKTVEEKRKTKKQTLKVQSSLHYLSGNC